MNIWIDALTPKQALLAIFLAKHLEKCKYRTIVTVRDYDFTVPLARRYRQDIIVVGSYGGREVESKLRADIERIKKLLEILDLSFDILIAYPNPSAARIAFGLGKPYIAITDSPHSEIPSRLALPLAEAVIASSCIPAKKIKSFMYARSRLLQFRGVDEVLWLREWSFNKQELQRFELREREYLVLRPEEKYATYYIGKRIEKSIWLKIIQWALRKDLKVIFIPRYEDQKRIVSQEYSNVITVEAGGVDGPTLNRYALAVITGGATMAREASLLGTVGVSMFPGYIDVNECVKSWGFPLFTGVTKSRKVLGILEKTLRDPDAYLNMARQRLKELEAPDKVVIKAIEILRGK